MQDVLVAVKGAGDLASGVIHRLSRAGFPVMATELPAPTVVRRTVAFAEAVALGRVCVEDVTACLASSAPEVAAALAAGLVPIVIDPHSVLLRHMQPTVLVEATVSKRNSGVCMADAPVVIALGPGYTAGEDVHAVIETQRGHNLGRVYLRGSALANTGVPGAIGGYTSERLLRAPRAGILLGMRQIGDHVAAGESVALIKTSAQVDEQAVLVQAAIDGVLRGLVRDGLQVSAGMKVGDIDPRAEPAHCFTISDKARAIAGGVMEAMLHLLQRKYGEYAQDHSVS
jgi:xanthine dehydrogenase accessory factor